MAILYRGALLLPRICIHRWGFPRRYRTFRGKPNVDVQTCGKCGAQRISPIQFGLLGSRQRAAKEAL